MLTAFLSTAKCSSSMHCMHNIPLDVIQITSYSYVHIYYLDAAPRVQSHDGYNLIDNIGIDIPMRAWEQGNKQPEVY
jgi:hypothetical protein